MHLNTGASIRLGPELHRAWQQFGGRDGRQDPRRARGARPPALGPGSAGDRLRHALRRVAGQIPEGRQRRAETLRSARQQPPPCTGGGRSLCSAPCCGGSMVRGERGIMADVGGVAGEQLKSFIERIERLEEEKRALSGDIKEVYAEAKGTGFEPKIMRQLVKIRKMDKEELDEEESLLDLYKRALGMAPEAQLETRAAE